MATLNPNIATICPNLDADAVREIIDTDLSTEQINNFINAAYYITIPLSSKLGSCGGSDALCQIMLLLSAHFLTMYERQSKSESVAGEWSITYLGKEGMGLESSLYGQNALALDCSGTLARAGMKRAEFQVASYKELADLPDDD